MMHMISLQSFFYEFIAKMYVQICIILVLFLYVFLFKTFQLTKKCKIDTLKTKKVKCRVDLKYNYINKHINKNIAFRMTHKLVVLQLCVGHLELIS